MLNSVLAVVQNGQIQTLEKIDLPDGKKVLVTLLPDDQDLFWQRASQVSLDEVWNNDEDDAYASLLEE